ncbi:MAG: hypothetical protein GKS06_19105 [Acidobacteria bacterium]|nr:hypothetical protein [Acidobacteriota bacterium]
MRDGIAKLSTLLLVTLAFPATAQEYDPLRAGADPSVVAKEMDARNNASNICWRRGEPVTVDWLAEHDTAFRRGAYSRYHLSELEDGWKWVRRDGGAGPDLRPTVEGVPYAELNVHARGTDDPFATLDVDSDLASGSVRFDWTAPPERLCMSDGLQLSAGATVEGGTPGARDVVIVLPLDAKQVAVQDAAVKACSPHSTTGVDTAVDLLQDSGRCERELFHLDPRAGWAVWVNLPESFYVVYQYEPDSRK